MTKTLNIPASELVTADDAAQLAAAVIFLRNLGERLRNEANRIDRDARDRVDLSRVATSSEVARNVVFDVLNNASAYLKAPSCENPSDLVWPDRA